jgi:hypothetical protein
MTDLPSPRLNHYGCLSWFPSKADCLEINVACNHFFAVRGMTFLSFADRIRLESVENNLSGGVESRHAGRLANSLNAANSGSSEPKESETRNSGSSAPPAQNTLPCAESTSREASRRSQVSSSVDAHSSAHGFLSVN